MNSSRTIKLKALILLVSFSLNSLVGFACSIGIDMGSNCKDHHRECKEKHKQAHEDDATCDDDDHHGSDDSRLQKDDDNIKHLAIVSFNTPPDDHCCEGYVVGFQKVDKELAQKHSTNYHKADSNPFEFYFNAILLFDRQVYKGPLKVSQKTSDHSPPDKRVFIHSFQI